MLQKTVAANPFMVFGEPDLEVKTAGDRREVTLRDVYDPTTQEIRSDSTDEVACCFIDTGYNGIRMFDKNIRIAMRTKLTITVDARLIPEAKRYARRKGTSLSRIIEQALRQAAASETPSFSKRWMGRFEPTVPNGDPRYDALAKKYL